MLLLLCFLQDPGKEQKEEDILKTPSNPSDVKVFIVFLFVCFFANLPALIVETICQSTAYYCVIIK